MRPDSAVGRVASGGVDVPTVDPQLLWDWLAGRSVARGLPLPVPAHGGMRVDSNTPSEVQRHLFAGPVPGIRDVTASIQVPRSYVKMCGPGEQLLAMAPPGWVLQSPAWLMIHIGAPMPSVPLPPGYRLEITRRDATVEARILTDEGALAASGFAVEYGSAYVFDRIATEPAHRRRGLGRSLMAALGTLQPSNASTRVLTATAEGRALYETLGWTVVSPYMTIGLPDPG